MPPALPAPPVGTEFYSFEGLTAKSMPAGWHVVWADRNQSYTFEARAAWSIDAMTVKVSGDSDRQYWTVAAVKSDVVAADIEVLYLLPVGRTV